MPDLADRERRERELASALAAALLALRTSLVEGSADWSAFRQDFQAALSGSLAETVAAAAEQLAREQGEGNSVDVSGGANGYATLRSSQFTADIVSRLQVAGAAGMPDAASLQSRADMIAITETTAAISAGSALAAVELALLLGRRSTWFWQTEEDDSVCATCAPLNGQEQPDIEPPAHPGCRCTKRYDFSRSLFEAAA
jgi:hypothetical protein